MSAEAGQLICGSVHKQCFENSFSQSLRVQLAASGGAGQQSYCKGNEQPYYAAVPMKGRCHLSAYSNVQHELCERSIVCPTYTERRALLGWSGNSVTYASCMSVTHQAVCGGQVSKEEVVQSLRKQSRGAQKTSSQYRGVTKHQKGKWEARIGQMVGRKYKSVLSHMHPLRHTDTFTLC